MGGEDGGHVHLRQLKEEKAHAREPLVEVCDYHWRRTGQTGHKLVGRGKKEGRREEGGGRREEGGGREGGGRERGRERGKEGERERGREEEGGRTKEGGKKKGREEHAYIFLHISFYQQMPFSTHLLHTHLFTNPRIHAFTHQHPHIHTLTHLLNEPVCKEPKYNGVTCFGIVFRDTNV